MGKLKINFLSNGQTVTPDLDDYKIISQVQSFQRKFKTYDLEKLNFESDDFTLNFDVDVIKDGVDWSNLEYPNDQVKNKVLDFLYYSEVADRLSTINSEIQRSDFSNRYQVQRKGEEAMEVIRNMENRPGYKDIEMNKHTKISELHHTMGKEVWWLMQVKHKDSNKKQNEALRDATRQLTYEINGFILALEHLED